MSLFRPEVIEEKRNRMLGTILLARPLTITLLTYFTILISAAVILFIVFGKYTRKERIYGRITSSSGTSKIYSPATGTITETFVAEGDVVSKNQLLYVISVAHNSSHLGRRIAIGQEIIQQRNNLDAEIENQQKLFIEETRALRERILELELQLSEVKKEKTLQTRRIALAKENLERARELFSSHHIAHTQVSDREQVYLDQAQRLQALARDGLAIQSEISLARSTLKSLPLNSASKVSTIRRELSSRQRENYENEAQLEVSIYSPYAGRATAVMVHVGQTVASNDQLITVLPHAANFGANLYAPSKAIGFLKGGERVQLRYEAFPYQKFGQYTGSIQSIARTAMSPESLGFRSNEHQDLYRIAIKLDKQNVTANGEQFDLQDGMLLEADVLLETRKLYEWVLDPLYSLTKRL